MSGWSETGITITVTIGSVVTSGQYFIESVKAQDQGNSITKTSLTVYGYGTWTLIKTNVNIT
jgi:hypothetical protein